MNISTVGSSGLQGTAAALGASQARFDAASEQVVADAAALGDPSAGAGGGDLTTDVVGMQLESLTNAVLAGVFKRQSDQQASLVQMLTP